MVILLKVVKFCLVGAAGMVLDFSITYLLKERARFHRYGANIIGFTCAATSNFVINRHWTFESYNPDAYHEYGLFVTFSLLGMIINTLFIILFERFNFSFYLSKFLAIIVTAGWNFTTNYFFTFNG